jgi:ADP-ribose pyrophosphatase YjhB (NUDIX family)
MPIISIGIIAYTVDAAPHTAEHERRYLMIRRKDTLGFVDFMRGKYSIYNKDYLLNIFNKMTMDEKQRILTESFSTLWQQMWENPSVLNHYKSEQQTSSEKFGALTAGICMGSEVYTLASLIEESNPQSQWPEAEWGFPKGRRNSNECDLDCAIREFVEETGYTARSIELVDNVLPFEEVFSGSNYKSYKHKYYLVRIQNVVPANAYDSTEVSKMEWKTFDECMDSIRSYNLEKKRVLHNVDACLRDFAIF